MKYAADRDEVWHAGDIGEPDICKELAKVKPLRAVFGNIDGAQARSEYPEDAVFFCEKVKVLITHIGGAFSKYNSRVKQLIQHHKPDLFICGHSHVCKVAYDKTHDLLYMNPGACGVHGFHKIKTLLRFQINENKIEHLEVVELGSRSRLNF